MLKKIFILLLLQVGIYNMYAQNVQRLETNPSFKGISIGMPISSIADELTYDRTVNGFTLYETTAASYCSVRGKRVDGALCPSFVQQYILGTELRSEIDVILIRVRIAFLF